MPDAVTTRPPLLAFEHVTIVRNDNTALDDVTVSIGAGEHVAIIGPNGSGKSTFIKAVNRELYPLAREESSLRVKRPDRWDVYALPAHLGIGSNDLMATCTRELTGRDVIISGFFSSIGIWPNHHVTDDMRAKADDILARLEVPYLADRFLTEMSSGEARRILIGRALAHDPDTLLLDEPTNSLDLAAMRELRGLFRRLAQAGTGILLVTHHLPDIIPEIERVILIKGGRIFRDGPTEEVLMSDALGELFGIPVELVKRDGYYHLL